MKIVIDVPEKVYNRFCRCCRFPDEVEEAIVAITDGTPLPKGHGRLFDERDIVNGNYEVIGNRIYELEPIIEADKAESVDKNEPLS